MSNNALVSLLTEMVKAFYTGTGYSGVHDPEYDMPDDISFFNRGNFERLKRYRKLAIDGNTVRAIEQADAGGDPVTKFFDVCTFNSAESLQKWLQKVTAQQTGDKTYSIVDQAIEGDNTWMR